METRPGLHPSGSKKSKTEAGKRRQRFSNAWTIGLKKVPSIGTFFHGFIQGLEIQKNDERTVFIAIRQTGLKFCSAFTSCCLNEEQCSGIRAEFKRRGRRGAEGRRERGIYSTGIFRTSKTREPVLGAAFPTLREPLRLCALCV